MVSESVSESESKFGFLNQNLLSESRIDIGYWISDIGIGYRIRYWNLVSVLESGIDTRIGYSEKGIGINI